MSQTDYEELYKLLLKGPVTREQIKEVTENTGGSIRQAIITMSINYPVWSPSPGVYKLVEESDYLEWKKGTYIKANDKKVFRRKYAGVENGNK